MSSSLLLILIGVVWLFVLAPLAVKSMKPIRRTSDALTETRVLHKGGSELPTRKRRPQVTRADIREHNPELDDLETVDADELSDEEAQLIVEEEPEAIIDGDEVLELEAVEIDDADDADDANDATDTEDADDAESEAAAELTSPSPIVADSTDDSVSADVLADDAADEEWMSSYVLPEDLMVLDDESEHPEALDRSFAGDSDPEFAEADGSETTADADDAVAAGTGGVDGQLDEAGAVEGAADDAADEAALLDSPDELTEEDLEFLRRRKGRGYLDPEAERHYAELRFQRRRRWVLVLLGVLLASLIAAVVLKSALMWAVPVAAAGLLGAYLWYLRKTVLAEKALRKRRIHHLRRARLGVRTAAADEMGIPERLRRPGAVVLEIDDEDPVFEHLEYTEWHPELDDEFSDEDHRHAG